MDEQWHSRKTPVMLGRRHPAAPIHWRSFERRPPVYDDFHGELRGRFRRSAVELLLTQHSLV